MPCGCKKHVGMHPGIFRGQEKSFRTTQENVEITWVWPQTFHFVWTFLFSVKLFVSEINPLLSFMSLLVMSHTKKCTQDVIYVRSHFMPPRQYSKAVLTETNLLRVARGSSAGSFWPVSGLTVVRIHLPHSFRTLNSRDPIQMVFSFHSSYHNL